MHKQGNPIKRMVLMADQQRLKDIVKRDLSPLQPIPTGESPKLSKLTDIRAILFDIYGTLLISGTGDISIAQEKSNHFSLNNLFENRQLRILHQDFSHIFQEIFHSKIQNSHRISKDKGISFPEVDILQIWENVMDTLFHEEILSGEMEKLDLLDLAIEYEILVNPVWPMPGTSSVLDHFKKTNFPLGIVSNAQFYTPLCLEALLDKTLDELGFQEELCCWSFDFGEAKPATELFKPALERLSSMGIKSKEVLYIGNDMLNDILTAQKLGCRTALFAGDRRSLRWRKDHPSCKDLTPDIILTELDQILECVK